MIIVTGATGVLNGATVEHLLKLVPADRIGVSVRDVAKAQHLADRGVRVRRGSYDDPAALLDSFEGAEQVLLVSSSDPAADQVSLHRAGIDTAVAAGARRILYTSHQSERAFDGPVTLTADTAVTFGDIAGVASELAGCDIGRVVVDDEEWVAGRVAHGSPEVLARFLLGVFQAAREGRFDGVDPLLGELLGRKPRTVRDLLASRLGEGRTG